MGIVPRFCPPAGVIVPRMDFALQTEPIPYDPQKASSSAEAGYRNGFVGDFTPNPGFPIVAEAVVNYLNAVGIRVRLRTMERAISHLLARQKAAGVLLAAVGASGNAATRAEAFMYSKGSYAYGGYPDLDELFEQQAVERDRCNARPCCTASSNSALSA